MFVYAPLQWIYFNGVLQGTGAAARWKKTRQEKQINRKFDTNAATHTHTYN